MCSNPSRLCKFPMIGSFCGPGGRFIFEVWNLLVKVIVTKRSSKSQKK